MEEEGIGINENHRRICLECMRDCWQFAIAGVTSALCLMDALGANHLIVEQIVPMRACIQCVEAEGKQWISERRSTSVRECRRPIVGHEYSGVSRHGAVCTP